MSAKAELPQRLRAGKPPIRAYGQRDAAPGNGDLRIRPNRPGPNRTERCLGIDHIQDTALVGGEESAAPRSQCLES